VTRPTWDADDLDPNFGVPTHDQAFQVVYKECVRIDASSDPAQVLNVLRRAARRVGPLVAIGSLDRTNTKYHLVRVAVSRGASPRVASSVVAFELSRARRRIARARGR